MSSPESSDSLNFIPADFDDASVDEVEQLVNTCGALGSIQTHSDWRTFKHIFLGSNPLMLDGLIDEARDAHGNVISSDCTMTVVDASMYLGPAALEDDQLTALLTESILNDTSEQTKETLEYISSQVPQAEKKRHQTLAVQAYQNGTYLVVEKDESHNYIEANLRVTGKRYIFKKLGAVASLRVTFDGEDAADIDSNYVAYKNISASQTAEDDADAQAIPLLVDQEGYVLPPENTPSKGKVREFMTALTVAMQSSVIDKTE